jgi:SP family general alpha glucoside:H+ symporter-like MFS transporter
MGTSRYVHLVQPVLMTGLMVAWLFTYDLTVGPIAYTIVGESSCTRLRNKTVALSRMSYNVCSVGFGVLMPYMLVSVLW